MKSLFSPIVSAYFYFDFESVRYRAAIYNGEVQFFSCWKEGWLPYDKATRWRLVMSKKKTKELCQHLEDKGVLKAIQTAGNLLEGGMSNEDLKQKIEKDFQ